MTHHDRLLWLILTLIVWTSDAVIYQESENYSPDANREQWQEVSQQTQEEIHDEKLSHQLCGNPENRANSEHNVTQPWVPSGTVAVYVCDVGYYTFGNDRRICQPNRRWSGEAPVCARKVSLGKNMSCADSQYVNSDETIFLMDGKDETCATVRINQNVPNGHIMVWKADLFEDYNAIASFRLVFQGQSANIPIAKISLENNHYNSHDIAPTECSITQRGLGLGNFHEIIIIPNKPQSGRYVTFYFKPRVANKPVEFCEAEVFDSNTPAVHQCFDKYNKEDTEITIKHLKNTAMSGKWCYTFNDQTTTWVNSNSMCETVNRGSLIEDLTGDINQQLASFAKVSHFQSHFWMGGRAKINYAPEKSQAPSIAWSWSNGNRIDKSLISAEDVQENDCLAFAAPRGIWLNVPCHVLAGSICKTAIRRCSSPPLESHVILVKPLNYSINAYLHHRCPQGLIMVGDERRQCMDNGQWSGHSPQCLAEEDHAAYQAQKNKLPDEAILGIIVAAIIVGLILIAVIVAIIVARKRGGRFKKKIYFHKAQRQQECDTVDTESRDDTIQLNADKKENYESVNQVCADEASQQPEQIKSS